MFQVFDLFDDFLGFPQAAFWSGYRPEQNLPLDVREEEGRYVIHAQLPGVRKEDVELRFEDGQLKFKAEKRPAPQAAEAETRRRYVHRERVYGRDQQVVALKNADPDWRRAALVDGELEVHGRRSGRRPTAVDCRRLRPRGARHPSNER